MTDRIYVDLQDPELFAEIRLLTDLMVAASEADVPLSQSVIDAICLGCRENCADSA